MAPVKCIFGCEDKTLHKGRKEHLDHAKYNCPMVLVVCGKCKTKMLKRNFAGHDCLESLINKIDGQDNHSTAVAFRELKSRFIDETQS